MHIRSILLASTLAFAACTQQQSAEPVEPPEWTNYLAVTVRRHCTVLDKRTGHSLILRARWDGNSEEFGAYTLTCKSDTAVLTDANGTMCMYKKGTNSTPDCQRPRV